MNINDVKFTKLTASGNDFICMDNRGGDFDAIIADPMAAGRFARALCDRHNGVGADGIIFACHNGGMEKFAEITCAHYEADGSECELCGNGSACFTQWIIDEGMVPDHTVDILTPAGVIQGKCMADGYVRVCISTPEQYRPDIDVTVEYKGEKKTFRCDYIVTGIPHAGVFVDDIESVNVRRWGRLLRWHDLFKPRGANINFIQILGPGEIAVRTFEFGVEDETLACGTGSSASAIMAGIRNLDWPAEIFSGDVPVTVHSHGGGILRVYFVHNDSGGITDVCLESKVQLLYRGRLNEDFLKAAAGE